MTKTMAADAGRKEARPAAPRLSHAVRALQLMLRDDCAVSDMDEPPYGRCGKGSHHEAREIIAAYKVGLR